MWGTTVDTLISYGRATDTDIWITATLTVVGVVFVYWIYYGNKQTIHNDDITTAARDASRPKE